jgi:N-acetylglutamate synthase-like GNAT family acetyltransferase
MKHDLICVPAGAARERFLPLLLLADDSEQQVRDYMNSGDLYAYSIEGVVAGVVLAIPMQVDVIELKAVAVEPSQQAQGIGKRMLSEVLAQLRAQGCLRAVVSTATAAISELAFYQKAGFRMSRIERDFFTPLHGYPEVMVDSGIRLRDKVWMDMSLEEIPDAG